MLYVTLNQTSSIEYQIKSEFYIFNYQRYKGGEIVIEQQHFLFQIGLFAIKSDRLYFGILLSDKNPLQREFETKKIMSNFVTHDHCFLSME